MAITGRFKRYIGSGVQKELVTVTVQEEIALCDKPCHFMDLASSKRVILDRTVLCTGVDLTGNEDQFKEVNKTNFPKCGFPTRESVAVFEASQQS